MCFAWMLQDELSSTQKSLEEAQEALRLSKEEAASMSKEAASAEAASEELVERLNTDNARLEASIATLHASALASAPWLHLSQSHHAELGASLLSTFHGCPCAWQFTNTVMVACLQLLACIQQYRQQWWRRRLCRRRRRGCGGSAASWRSTQNKC